MSSASGFDNICEVVCGYIRDFILAEGVALDSQTRLSDLGVDSVSLVEILLFIERRYGVTVPDEQLTRENLKTVAALAECVRRIGEGEGESS